MSRESRLTAGILLILMSTVVYGGASILSMLVGDPYEGMGQEPSLRAMRETLFRRILVHFQSKFRVVSYGNSLRGLTGAVRHPVEPSNLIATERSRSWSC